MLVILSLLIYAMIGWILISMIHPIFFIVVTIIVIFSFWLQHKWEKPSIPQSNEAEADDYDKKLREQANTHVDDLPYLDDLPDYLND